MFNYKNIIRNTSASEEYLEYVTSQSSDAWGFAPDAQEKPEQTFWASDAQDDADMDCVIYWAEESPE